MKVIEKRDSDGNQVFRVEDGDNYAEVSDVKNMLAVIDAWSGASIDYQINW